MRSVVHATCNCHHRSFVTVASAVVVCAVFCLMTTGVALGQGSGGKEPIQVEKKFGGYKFTYQGTEIKKTSELRPIVQGFPEAVAAVDKSEAYNGGAMVLAAIGGALIGWPVGEAIGGKDDPKWVLAGAGAGAVTVGIVLGMQGVKHAKRAVDIYNGGVGQSSEDSANPRLVLGPGRVSVLFRF
jgi:hypothetical protein